MNPHALSGYREALESCAIYHHSNGGVIHLEGADSYDFLQRQTTNDINQISPTRSIFSVLTNPAARILDVIFILQSGKTDHNPEETPALDLITLPSNAVKTYQYLRSRIFFMDKVKVDDHSDKFRQFDLIGPEAVTIIRHLGHESPITPNELVQVDFAAINIRILHWIHRSVLDTA